jgi:hypothetical protein
MNEEHNISLLVTMEYPQLDQPAILAHVVRELEKAPAIWLPSVAKLATQRAGKAVWEGFAT